MHTHICFADIVSFLRRGVVMVIWYDLNQCSVQTIILYLVTPIVGVMKKED